MNDKISEYLPPVIPARGDCPRAEKLWNYRPFSFRGRKKTEVPIRYGFGSLLLTGRQHANFLDFLV
jgi:hypothetical protein